MKRYTLTYHTRNSRKTMQAVVFSDTACGAEKALLEWEGSDLIITSAKEGAWK